MNASELGRIFDRANDSFERAQQIGQRADRSVDRANQVMRRLDERSGPVRDAARRERQRVNADFGRRLARVGVAIGLVSLATIVIGLVIPIGMFGFIAAVGLAIGLAAVLGFMPSAQRGTAAPAADLPNGPMVQRFDSYLFRVRRALPASAQGQIDAISAALPALRQTLERVDVHDANAQDARRLMSLHLPGLIDRYVQVPADFRNQPDGEGKTADERLVEALAAGRAALGEIAESLARQDLAALETQGRFITSRYGEDGPTPAATGERQGGDSLGR